MNTTRYLLISVAGPRGARTQTRALTLLAAAPHVRAATVAVQVPSFAEVAKLLTDYPQATPVAAGGDGTVNLVAAGLLALEPSAQRALAVLPLGSGNALAHALGVAAPPRALATLVQARVRRFDVMRTDRPEAPLALISVSTGTEGDLIGRYAQARARSPHDWRARAQGAVAGLRALAGGPRTGTSLCIDGRELVRANEPTVNVGLYNFPMYALGLRVWPDADPTDGRAEAAAHMCRRTYLRALLSGARTAHSSSGTDYRCARWQHAELSTAAAIQMDGESVSAGTLKLRVDRGALPMMVPLDASPRT